ncbi:MAG: serine/threonine-protein kinase [Ruminococcaceae bacterium]|nr:serine/threonine-protein kinase [Oscillospiraceae bacterium]
MSELYDIGKLWQDWETVRLIGEGSFGKVYEIARNRFGIEEHCALKVITIPDSKAEVQSLKNDGMDDQSVTAYYRGLVEEVVQEIALMKKLRNNNNIVRYEDFCVVEHEDSFGWDIVIRMELLKASPVYFKEISLTVSEVLKLGIDMCKALEDCETHKIIHRDIKPDNIFVSEDGTYKLGDFGVARTIDKTMAGLSKKGTYTFMAPEV